jgi:hypothetical protein
MPAGGQLKELRITMCKLFWKMLRVLTLGHFCIPIGSRKRVMWIVMLTRASDNNCQKSIAKKFETLTIKHAMPSMNSIVQTKVGTK